MAIDSEPLQASLLVGYRVDPVPVQQGQVGITYPGKDWLVGENY